MVCNYLTCSFLSPVQACSQRQLGSMPVSHAYLRPSPATCSQNGAFPSLVYNLTSLHPPHSFPLQTKTLTTTIIPPLPLDNQSPDKNQHNTIPSRNKSSPLTPPKWPQT
jgi:hypothetical protein